MYFDLSIPYVESNPKPVSTTQSQTQTQTRLEILTRILTLGYTAVAYDRLITSAVISDADRCFIKTFETASLNVGPSFAASVKLHREQNGVRAKEVFRQYRRVTVSLGNENLEKIGKAKAILKSYDLLAVRPLDQKAFDWVCANKNCEVDIISLDLSRKFRLKPPMVEAAIKRGVYFEIKYAGLIADVNTRTQMLADARLLIDWTGGKNIIFSSSATSVNDIRGPHDITNLVSTLLGLSKERAVAAISKNCSSLIANALRKKDYKEAIKIERIPSDKEAASSNDLFSDWKEWDPLSTGGGDLPPLDDMSKLFSDTNKLTKIPPAIDFSSCAKGFSLEDHISSSPKCLSVSKKAASVAFLNESKFKTSAVTDSVLSQRETTESSAQNNNTHSETTESYAQNNAYSDTVDLKLKHRTSEDKDSLLVDSYLTCVPTVDEISSFCMEDVQDPSMYNACVSSIETPMEKDNIEEKYKVETAQIEKITKAANHDNPIEAMEPACVVLNDIPFENDVSECKEEVISDNSVEKDACMKAVKTEDANHDQHMLTSFNACASQKLKSGKRRQKGKNRPAQPLPFKNLLKPMFFKKRSRQSRKPSKHGKDRL